MGGWDMHVRTPRWPFWVKPAREAGHRGGGSSMELTISIAVDDTTDASAPAAAATSALLVLLAGFLVGACAWARFWRPAVSTATCEIRLPSGALVTVHGAHR